jgi:hypothetical protein
MEPSAVDVPDGKVTDLSGFDGENDHIYSYYGIPDCDEP